MNRPGVDRVPNLPLRSKRAQPLGDDGEQAASYEALEVFNAKGLYAGPTLAHVVLSLALETAFEWTAKAWPVELRLLLGCIRSTMTIVSAVGLSANWRKVMVPDTVGLSKVARTVIMGAR